MSVWSKTNINGSLILIISMILTNVFFFLLSIILVRTISIEDFATFTVLNSIFFLIAIFTQSVGSTLQHQISGLRGSGNRYILPSKKIFFNSLFISIAFGLLWIIFAPQIAETLKINQNYAILLISPVLFLILIYTIKTATLHGNFLFKYLSIIILTEAISKTLVGAYGALTNNIFLVFASLPISLLLSLLVALILVKKTIPNDNVIHCEKFPWKFYKTILTLNIVNSSFLVVDVILVKIFFNTVTAGYYAILTIIGKMLLIAGKLPASFTLSFISYESNRNKNPSTTFNILSSSSLFLVGITYIGLIVFNQQAFTLTFGNKILPILTFIPLYGLAIILYTAINIIATYHIAQKNYKVVHFPLIALVFTSLGITIFHKTLFEVIWTLLIANGIAFVLISVYHNLYNKKKKFRSLSLFLNEVTGIFKKINLQNGKKNILFFNWRDILHNEAGGAEKYIHEISKRLVKKGYAVTLFTSNDGNNKSIETIDNVTIIRKGGFLSVYIFAFIYYIFQLRKWANIIIDGQNGVPFFTAVYARKSVILLVHHVHQKVFKKQLPTLLSYFACWIEKDLMKMFYKNKQIITVSPSTKQELINLGFKKDKVEIIYNGVNNVNDEKIILKNKRDEPLIVYLGRIQRYKRVDMLIDAFKIISRDIPEAKLLIAGDGSHINELENNVKTLEIHNKITFTGYVTENEKSKILEKTWVIVQPSEQEGWSITNLEANTYGIPCIGFDVPGIRDSIINNQTGILCEEETVESLAKNIKDLINNPDKISELSKNAYIFSKNYTWEKSVDQFLNVIEKNDK